MSSDSTIKSVTVSNTQGLHARPAHAIVTLAGRYQARIEIIRDGEAADARSILAILTLAAEQGTELTIKATGTDADQATEAIAELISHGFTDEDVSAEQEESQTGGPSHH
jgi:phosphocarrier protein